MDTLKFSYYDSVERGAVTVFTDAHCKHTFGRFQVPETVEQAAWVNYANMCDTLWCSTRIGSIMVPYGYSLQMYNSDGFVDTAGGAEVVLGGAWSSGEQAMTCINLSELGSSYRNWDDGINSFAVYRSSYGGVATGSWLSITATEGINFTYHLGLTS